MKTINVLNKIFTVFFIFIGNTCMIFGVEQIIMNELLIGFLCLFIGAICVIGNLINLLCIK